jgi:hypothetical protein
VTTNLNLGSYQYSGGSLNLSLINKFTAPDGVSYYLLDVNANGSTDGGDRVTHVELDKFFGVADTTATDFVLGENSSRSVIIGEYQVTLLPSQNFKT